jgi:hypothetical protein
MHSGVAQLATLGGFICVIDASGGKSAYGLTVGHVLPPTLLYDDDTQLSSNNEEDDSSSGTESDSNTSGSTVEDDNEGLCQSTLDDSGPMDESGQMNGQNWLPLGNMSRVSGSERARDRDWALIELQTLTHLQTELSRTPATCSFEAARAVGSEAVAIGGSTARHCIVSEQSTRAVLPSGRAFAFVDMQVLQHENQEGQYENLTHPPMLIMSRFTSRHIWIMGRRSRTQGHHRGLRNASCPGLFRKPVDGAYA